MTLNECINKLNRGGLTTKDNIPLRFNINTATTLMIIYHGGTQVMLAEYDKRFKCPSNLADNIVDLIALGTDITVLCHEEGN